MPRRAPLVLALAPLLLVVGLVAFFESRRSERPQVSVSPVAGGLAVRVDSTRDDRALDRAIDTRDPALFTPRLGPASCAEDTSETSRRAARHASFRFLPRTEGELRSALDPQLGNLHATVVTTPREGLGPLAPRMDGLRFGTGDLPHRLVLVVDALDDPSPDARGAPRGHLVLWSRARHAPVCAARLAISAPDEAAPSDAHPLAYARARLVMQAIHEGLGQLSSIAP